MGVRVIWSERARNLPMWMGGSVTGDGCAWTRLCRSVGTLYGFPRFPYPLLYRGDGDLGLGDLSGFVPLLLLDGGVGVCGSLPFPFFNYPFRDDEA